MKYYIMLGCLLLPMIAFAQGWDSPNFGSVITTIQQKYLSAAKDTVTISPLRASKDTVTVADEFLGYTRWAKIGFNETVSGSAEETIIPQGGNYRFLTAADSLKIVSSSTADDGAPAGLGARTIRIYYLTDAYVEKTIDITMNGTDSVGTGGVKDIFRINNCRVVATGDSGFAVGNITITNGTGVRRAIGYILATENRMKQLVWTVPKGKTLYIQESVMSAVETAANKYTRLRMLSSYDDKMDSVFTSGNHFVSIIEASLTLNAIAIQFPIPIRIPQYTDLKFVAKSNGTSAVNASLRGYVLP
jgi:hypothetical protein